LAEIAKASKQQDDLKEAIRQADKLPTPLWQVRGQLAVAQALLAIANKP
jgi:hypothetical protein